MKKNLYRELYRFFNEIFQSNDVALKCEISNGKPFDVKYLPSANVKYSLPRMCMLLLLRNGIELLKQLNICILVWESLVERKREGVGAVVPEAVKAIEGTFVTVEEMDDDLAVIQDDPAAFAATLTPAEIQAFLCHHLIHSIRKGRDLGVAAAGSDNHSIAQDGEVGHVQDCDILGFAVIEETSETKYGFLILHDLSSNSYFERDLKKGSRDFEI